MLLLRSCKHICEFIYINLLYENVYQMYKPDTILFIDLFKLFHLIEPFMPSMSNVFVDRISNGFRYNYKNVKQWPNS